MAGIESFLSRYRLKYRPASTALKIVVLITSVVCIAVVLTLCITIHTTRQQTQQLQSQIAQVQRESSRLKTLIQDAGTVKGVKRIAMEELGLVDPDVEILQIPD